MRNRYSSTGYLIQFLNFYIFKKSKIIIKKETIMDKIKMSYKKHSTIAYREEDCPICAVIRNYKHHKKIVLNKKERIITNVK